MHDNVISGASRIVTVDRTFFFALNEVSFSFLKTTRHMDHCWSTPQSKSAFLSMKQEFRFIISIKKVKN